MLWSPRRWRCAMSTDVRSRVREELASDQRYVGPGIPTANADGTASAYMGLGIGKTIAARADGAVPDLSIAKGELDALAYIAGGMWISSQGRIKFVPLFDP